MPSDSVVIGIVLGLVFAAVSYYLYSRIGQLERKVGLMENILLDLKVTTEQALISATEPEHSHSNFVQSPGLEENTVVTHDEREVNVKNAPRSNSSKQRVQVERTSVSANYEAMTYKELIQVAKQKNITGTRNLSKSQVIDMIRRHDSGDVSEQVEEDTDLTGLLSAQPEGESAASLDDGEVDTSLGQ
jgi:hypothetical protein